MTKHTPGPWYFHHFRGSKARIISLKSERYGPNWDIANVISGLGESNQEQIDANARLIAAAPDLLRTLKEIADLDPQTDSTEGFNEWGESDCFRQAQAKARAAIAKAEGKDHD